MRTDRFLYGNGLIVVLLLGWLGLGMTTPLAAQEADNGMAQTETAAVDGEDAAEAAKHAEQLRKAAEKEEQARQRREAQEAKAQKQQQAQLDNWEKLHGKERREQASLQLELQGKLARQLVELGELTVKITENRRREQQLQAFLTMMQRNLDQLTLDATNHIGDVRKTEDEELRRLQKRLRFNGVCLRQLTPGVRGTADASATPLRWTLIVNWNQPVTRNSVLHGMDISFARRLPPGVGAYLVVITPVEKKPATGAGSELFPGYQKWRTSQESQLADAQKNVTQRQLEYDKLRLELATAKTLTGEVQERMKEKIDSVYAALRQAQRDLHAVQERLHEVENAKIFFPKHFAQFSGDYRLRTLFRGQAGLYAIRGNCNFTQGALLRSATFQGGPFYPTGSDISRLTLPNGLVALPGDYVALIVPTYNSVAMSKVPNLTQGDSYYFLPANWKEKRDATGTNIILDLNDKNRSSLSLGRNEWPHAEFMVYGDWLFQSKVPL